MQKIGLHSFAISVDYFLDCTSVWIQYLCMKDLYKNEQRSHCPLWWCLVVCNHNILQSLEMSLNHHHTWSICPSWKIMPISLLFYIGKNIKHLTNNRPIQNEESLYQSVDQFVKECSRYNLLHFDRAEEIQVM